MKIYKVEICNKNLKEELILNADNNAIIKASIIQLFLGNEDVKVLFMFITEQKFKDNWLHLKRAVSNHTLRRHDYINSDRSANYKCNVDYFKD